MEYLRFCCSSSYLQCQWNSELQFTNCFTQNHRVIKLSVSNVMAVNSCSLLDRKLCSLTSMCCGGQWHPPPRGDHWKHVHFNSQSVEYPIFPCGPVPEGMGISCTFFYTWCPFCYTTVSVTALKDIREWHVLVLYTLHYTLLVFIKLTCLNFSQCTWLSGATCRCKWHHLVITSWF